MIHAASFFWVPTYKFAHTIHGAHDFVASCTHCVSPGSRHFRVCRAGSRVPARTRGIQFRCSVSTSPPPAIGHHCVCTCLTKRGCTHPHESRATIEGTHLPYSMSCPYLQKFEVQHEGWPAQLITLVTNFRITARYLGMQSIHVSPKLGFREHPASASIWGLYTPPSNTGSMHLITDTCDGHVESAVHIQHSPEYGTSGLPHRAVADGARLAAPLQRAETLLAHHHSTCTPHSPRAPQTALKVTRSARCRIVSTSSYGCRSGESSVHFEHPQ